MSPAGAACGSCQPVRSVPARPGGLPAASEAMRLGCAHVWALEGPLPVESFVRRVETLVSASPLVGGPLGDDERALCRRWWGERVAAERRGRRAALIRRARRWALTTALRRHNPPLRLANLPGPRTLWADVARTQGFEHAFRLLRGW